MTLSRTARRITVALMAAALAALAALPAGSPARDRAVSLSRPRAELVAYITRTQWRDPVLAVDEARLVRREARERARLRRERAHRRHEERLAAERAQQAKLSTKSASSQVSTDSQVTTAPVSSGSPQEIAEGMLASYGWSGGQFGCLVSLWNVESGWNLTATNPSSGAYGIPQSLPGSKMASAGPDWETDAATQIRWGLSYIQSTYGSPCAAWGHEESAGWY
jgi:hypothetical protein